MSFAHITILAIIQGLAELLPISSSAHVVVAERLLGLDAASPPMTLLLVMLHTGTMCAVIVYFWRPWRASYLRDRAALRSFAAQLVLATALTAAIGGGLVLLIEHVLRSSAPSAQIEDLFDHLELIAPALAAAGVLICIAGWAAGRGRDLAGADLNLPRAAVIGAVQGLCLPFRGFSRSGATISTAMLLKIERLRAESFSFALAVVLTPPVVAREAMRLWRAERLAGAAGAADLMQVAGRCALGALLAFLAGLAALKWLSRWLENGRWYLFGIYCLLAAGAVGILRYLGH